MTVRDLTQACAAKRGPRGATGAVSPSTLLTGALLAAGMLGLWLLTHPYEGIVHDARLYVGHVLAAADPNGVGQDIMFTEDGQFGLSAFPPLLAAVIGALGVSTGAKLIALAGLLAWVGALACLAASMAKGRDRWAIFAFVVVLPTSYGGFHVFHYAEPFATPRVFAEAGVLLAFALICWGRIIWALLPLAAAVLLHPIMVLPGLGLWVWFALFDTKDRIFALPVSLALATGAVLSVLLAAAFQVPLAERLFMVVDPNLRDVMTTRTPDLFPALWPFVDWSRLLVQLATLAIAAHMVAGRLRSLLVATIVVGIGGIAAAYLLADVFNSLLAVQAQLWRSVWIVGVMSAAALAIGAIALWRQGGNARLVVGLLLIAWLSAEMPAVALPAVVLAGLFTFWPLVREMRIEPKLTLAFWGFVGFYALLHLGIRLYSLAVFAADAPAGSANLVSLLSMFGVWSIPVCALALVYALADPKERVLVPLGVLAVVVSVLGVAFWDLRNARTLAADDASGDPALKALLASHPGEVLWLDGRFETWGLAGRANWISTLQGASAVFSRPLAETWDRRARFLTDLGVVDERLRTPFGLKGRTSNEEPSLGNVSDAALEKLCALPDAPAWIIASAESVPDGAISRDRWSASRWRASHPATSFGWDGKMVTWRTTQDYVVLRCAP